MINLSPIIIVKFMNLLAAVCLNNAVSCGENSCICKEGYAPFDCCECLPTLVLDSNQECKPCPAGQKPNNDETGCICESGNNPNANGDCIGKCLYVANTMVLSFFCLLQNNLVVFIKLMDPLHDMTFFLFFL